MQIIDLYIYLCFLIHMIFSFMELAIQYTFPFL